jgi:hypothetical protein
LARLNLTQESRFFPGLVDILDFVNQQPVGFDMAFERTGAVTCKLVFAKRRRQRRFVLKAAHHRQHLLHGVPALLTAFEILLERRHIRRPYKRIKPMQT